MPADDKAMGFNPSSRMTARGALDLQKELRHAVQVLNVPLAAELLLGVQAAGESTQQVVNTRDNEGQTLLHHCAQSLKSDFDGRGDRMMDLLLSHGADVDMQNESWEPPLAIAVRSAARLAPYRASLEPELPRLGAVQRLLEVRASANVADFITGETPLVEAACVGDTPLCSLLLGFRADPEKGSQNSLSAAQAAVDEVPGLVALLSGQAAVPAIPTRAPTRAPPPPRRSPPKGRQEDCRASSSDYAAAGLQTNTSTASSDHPLVVAARRGNLHEARRILGTARAESLANGFLHNLPLAEALVAAVRLGDKPLAQLLLVCRADPLEGHPGSRALDAAGGPGWRRLLRAFAPAPELWDTGGGAEDLREWQDTLTEALTRTLRELVRVGDVELVRESIENVKHLGADMGALPASRALAEALNHRNACGQMLLHLCVKAEASVLDREGVLDLLLDAGARGMSSKNQLGETPLHLAVREACADAAEANRQADPELGVVLSLIQAEASVNTADVKRETPLMEAVAAGSMDLILVLLNHRADPYARSADGLCPLDFACHDPDVHVIFSTAFSTAEDSRRLSAPHELPSNVVVEQLSPTQSELRPAPELESASHLPERPLPTEAEHACWAGLSEQLRCGQQHLQSTHERHPPRSEADELRSVTPQLPCGEPVQLPSASEHVSSACEGEEDQQPPVPEQLLSNGKMEQSPLVKKLVPSMAKAEQPSPLTEQVLPEPQKSRSELSEPQHLPPVKQQPPLMAKAEHPPPVREQLAPAPEQPLFLPEQLHTAAELEGRAEEAEQPASEPEQLLEPEQPLPPRASLSKGEQSVFHLPEQELPEQELFQTEDLPSDPEQLPSTDAEEQPSAPVDRFAEFERMKVACTPERALEAIQDIDIDCLEYILNKSSTAEQQDIVTFTAEQEQTLLHLVAQVNPTEVEAPLASAMVWLLLAAGADVQRCNLLGESALLTAVQSAALIHAENEECEGASRLQVVKAFIEANADVNMADTIQSETPLMWAAGEDDLEQCQLLLSARADPLQKNKGGLTAEDMVSSADSKLAEMLRAEAKLVLARKRTQQRLQVIRCAEQKERESLQHELARVFGSRAAEFEKAAQAQPPAQPHAKMPWKINEAKQDGTPVKPQPKMKFAWNAAKEEKKDFDEAPVEQTDKAPLKPQPKMKMPWQRHAVEKEVKVEKAPERNEEDTEDEEDEDDEEYEEDEEDDDNEVMTKKKSRNFKFKFFEELYKQDETASMKPKGSTTIEEAIILNGNHGQEARQKAEEKATQRAEEEASLKAKERLKAKEEARRKAAEESRLKAEEEEARLKAEEEAMLKAEEEARLKSEEEASLKAEEDKAEEEARLKAEEEARLKAEEEARLKAEEEARLKAEEEAKLKAEEEARLKAEEEARLKAEEETRLKAEEDARLKAEEEARLKAEEEARLKADEEARLKAASEEKARRLRAEEEARLKAEEEAMLKAEEEAMLKAEEEARLKAEEEARLKAEEESRLKTEEEARMKAEEEARLKAEEESRLKAEEEASLKAEEEARLKAEEEARLKAEEEARLKAAEEARLKAEEEARLKAEEETRLSTEEESRLKAEEEARLKASVQERLQAEVAISMAASSGETSASMAQQAWERLAEEKTSVNVEMPQELLEAASNPNPRNLRRILKASDNTKELLRWQDEDGYTLLHKVVMSAPSNKVFATAAVLMTMNAELEARNLLGDTPLMVASRTAMEHSKNIADACPERLTDLFGPTKYLLKYEANVNARDSGCNETPLMEAACNGNIVMCELLLEFRADASLRAHTGFRALEWAESSGHLHVAEFLRGVTEKDEVTPRTAEPSTPATGPSSSTPTQTTTSTPTPPPSPRAAETETQSATPAGESENNHHHEPSATPTDTASSGSQRHSVTVRVRLPMQAEEVEVQLEAIGTVGMLRAELMQHICRGPDALEFTNFNSRDLMLYDPGDPDCPLSDEDALGDRRELLAVAVSEQRPAPDLSDKTSATGQTEEEASRQDLRSDWTETVSDSSTKDDAKEERSSTLFDFGSLEEAAPLPSGPYGSNEESSAQEEEPSQTNLWSSNDQSSKDRQEERPSGPSEMEQLLEDGRRMGVTVDWCKDLEKLRVLVSNLKSLDSASVKNLKIECAERRINTEGVLEKGEMLHRVRQVEVWNRMPDESLRAELLRYNLPYRRNCAVSKLVEGVFGKIPIARPTNGQAKAAARPHEGKASAKAPAAAADRNSRPRATSAAPQAQAFTASAPSRAKPAATQTRSPSASAVKAPSFVPLGSHRKAATASSAADSDLRRKQKAAQKQPKNQAWSQEGSNSEQGYGFHGVHQDIDMSTVTPKIRKHLQEFPGYSGEMPPADAEELWTDDELHSFFFSSGFIRPKKKNNKQKPKLSPVVMAQHYRTLGVQNGSKPDVVRKAYRQLALKYHPDKNPSAQDATKFTQLSEAYEAVCYQLQEYKD